MRKRSKSSKDSKNHKKPSQVAKDFMRISSKVKNHLVKESIKVDNGKGEEVDETLNQTLERLLGLNEKQFMIH